MQVRALQAMAVSSSRAQGPTGVLLLLALAGLPLAESWLAPTGVQRAAVGRGEPARGAITFDALDQQLVHPGSSVRWKRGGSLGCHATHKMPLQRLESGIMA